MPTEAIHQAISASAAIRTPAIGIPTTPARPVRSRRSQHDWTLVPRVAVVGADAVGGYFGGMLARAGVHVTLIGRAAHVNAEGVMAS
jgi:pyruvate/2-oxoglutarate dehydrogenase complex dihydrolipoamide dehydrogenase (E3) component